MMWRVVTLSLLVVIAVVSAGSSNSEAPATHEPFTGIRLGMSEADALAAMRDLDPGAISGKVCRGDHGVLGYVKHLDMTWQLMAHVERDRVNQIRLYRSSRKGLRTVDACRVHFAKVAAYYRAKHPNAGWKTVDASTAEHGLDMTSRAVLPNGAGFELRVTRGTRKLSLCTVDIGYVAPDEKQMSRLKRP